MNWGYSQILISIDSDDSDEQQQSQYTQTSTATHYHLYLAEGSRIVCLININTKEGITNGENLLRIGAQKVVKKCLNESVIVTFSNKEVLVHWPEVYYAITRATTRDQLRFRHILNSMFTVKGLCKEMTVLLEHVLGNYLIIINPKSMIFNKIFHSLLSKSRFWSNCQSLGVIVKIRYDKSNKLSDTVSCSIFH